MENSDYIPDKFVFKYGPALRSYEGFSITLEKGNLIYRDGHILSLDERSLNPTQSQWIKFWSTVDEIGLWNWNEKYDLCCLDGVKWSIQISIQGHEIESEGSNDFPDSFNEFIKAIEDLIDEDIKLN